MPQELRKEFSLRKLRRIVREVYEQNGYEILSWLEGACPKDLKKFEKEAPLADLVLDLAIDAISRAYGKEPRKEYARTSYHHRRKINRRV